MCYIGALLLFNGGDDMASPFMNQMSARTEGWREDLSQYPEYRSVMHYAGYGLLAVLVSRIVIEISRHFSFLMPLGILAALIFSAFELALVTAGLILASIALCAVVGLSLSALLRILKIAR
jgi:hypothetical protein